MDFDDKKKKRQLQPASSVLQALLGNGKSALSDGFLRWKIWRLWPKIVGPTIASHCEPVGFARGVLYVWVKSSSRMQELRFFEQQLKSKVNEHVGRTWARNIRFTLDRHGVPNADNVSPEFKKMLDEEPQP